TYARLHFGYAWALTLSVLCWSMELPLRLLRSCVDKKGPSLKQVVRGYWLLGADGITGHTLPAARARSGVGEQHP
ncbi:MAG: hypothetical protein RLN70_10350, partial [Rhodospirillaceae bacterium]